MVFLVFAGVIMNIVTNKSCTLSESESSEISKILITNGNTGDVKKIEDEAGILKINDSFRKVKGKKEKREPSSGWMYYVDFYEKNGNVKRVVFVSEDYCKIDDEDYIISAEDGKTLLKKISASL